MILKRVSIVHLNIFGSQKFITSVRFDFMLGSYENHNLMRVDTKFALPHTRVQMYKF